MKHLNSRRKRVGKKQWLLMFGWIVILLAAWFPARYSNRIYAYGAFLFLLFLDILVMIVLLVQGRQIEAVTGTAGDMPDSCMRGETVDLKLGISNRSIFLCPWASAEFFISNLFGGTDAVQNADFTIAGRSESEFSFSVDMKHIGVYQVGVRKIWIRDMFGMLEKQKTVNRYYEICVKPNIYPLEDLQIDEKLYLDTSEERRNTVPNGMDYVGVREYVPGDSMKQIHWKLSAHSVNYMTRLSENSCQSDVAVLLDTAASPTDEEELMTLYDTLVETTFSILEELEHRDVVYSMVCCDRQRQVWRCIPKGRENDMDYIRQMHPITADLTGAYPDGAFLVEQESQASNRCTNLILCTSRITAELIQQLLLVKRNRRQPELYLIYPERLVQREREELLAPLRALDEAEIPWHLVSTEHSAAMRQTEEVSRR